MRTRIALLTAALVVSVLAPPGSQAATLGYTIPATAGSIATVDLLLNANDTVQFVFDKSASNNTANQAVQSAFVVLQKGIERIDVTLTNPSSGNVWTGLLPVATTSLSKGIWSVSTVAVNSTGVQAQVEPPRSFNVGANDSTPPTISFVGEIAGRVNLGPSDVLALRVNDPLLRAVSYRLPSIVGEIPLQSPYVLPLNSFREGSQDLTVRATDRAGNEANRTVRVVVDTTAPFLSASLPSRLFVGLPANMTVTSSDASNYTVTAEINGTTTTRAGSGAGNYSFPFTPAANGTVHALARVRDALGNSVEVHLQGNATVPETDSAIGPVEVSPARPIIGDAVVARVTLRQVTGVTPLDLRLDYQGVNVGNLTANVPGPGDKVVEVPLQVSVGRHHLAFNVTAPTSVVETNSTNQNQTLDFEVYFGYAKVGNATYYIQAGDLPLPTAALGPNGTTYPLRIVDRGVASLYEFKLPNNTTVTWNPLDPRGNASTSSSSTSGSPVPADEAPAPTAALLALVLAVFALLRRRRA